VLCYAPTHTFVEKLQTISTKYRRLGESAHFPGNFLRHYYDVYCLLALDEVKAFIQLPEYQTRKDQRFRTGDEQVIANNPAFLLEDLEQRRLFETEYRKTQALYYQGQPEFSLVLARIHQYISSM
jgi:Nucleotidyl transferase AbiEii toxin, Type IV TA system